MTDHPLPPLHLKEGSCTACGTPARLPYGVGLCGRCEEATTTFSEADWDLVEAMTLEDANVYLLARREQLELGHELAEGCEKRLAE